MKSIGVLLHAVAVAMAAGVVLAAEPSVQAARQCAAIADSNARVACYDQLFAAPAGAVAAPAAPAGGIAAVAGTAAAPAIGDEALKKSSAERAAASTPASIDARITALREMRPNVYRISLDNGQVWQQEESETLFHPAIGDPVRIQKGALGRYDMSRLTNGKTAGWARVTRRE